MKKKLILKYVAHKLAMIDEVAAEAKSSFSSEEYVSIVKGSLASELPPKFRLEIEDIIRKRFSLRRHESLFLKPTVEQWIADLTGQLSVNDVYSVFAQLSGLSADTFRTARYGDNILNRPFLEDIVEMLEAATGVTSCAILKNLRVLYARRFLLFISLKKTYISKVLCAIKHYSDQIK